VRGNVLTSCRVIQKLLGFGLWSSVAADDHVCCASVGHCAQNESRAMLLRNCVNATHVLLPFLTLCLYVAYDLHHSKIVQAVS